MPCRPPVSISLLSSVEIEDHLSALARLLRDCVHAGASISFVLPFEEKDGGAFWKAKVLPAVADGSRCLWIARAGHRIVGSVQLDWDTPPNQPHRAEVRKLLVHPDLRRQGIARALMAALERHALAIGRTLITLDTVTGGNAEPLYASLGYRTVGVIPGYARDPIADRRDPTTIMYKDLASPG